MTVYVIGLDAFLGLYFCLLMHLLIWCNCLGCVSEKRARPLCSWQQKRSKFAYSYCASK